MSLRDLGRPSGVPACEYPPRVNAELKAIQALAYDHAVSVVYFDDEESSEDYTARWNEAYNAKLRGFGWEYTGDHRMCADPDYGHELACGWSRVIESGSEVMA